EGPHHATRQCKDADRCTFAQEGYAKMGAKPSQSLSFIRRIFRVGQNIRNLNGLALQQDSAGNSPSSWKKRECLHVLIELAREAVVRRRTIARFFTRRAEELSRVRLAEPRRRIHKRVKHRRQIERRSADDLEDVCGCRLLLKGLAKFAATSLHL